MKTKMKTKIKTGEFPIKLSIKIETEQELCDLLNRLNVPKCVINDLSSPYKFGAAEMLTHDLWDKLDDVAYYLGLKK